MSSLTIRPLNTGFDTPSAARRYHESIRNIYPPPGPSDRLPFFAFLVEGGDRPLLVDAGVSAPEHARLHHSSEGLWPEDMTIMDHLKRLGYELGDIGYLVLTHLHWDHCVYMNRFPNARFFVHPKEIEFARHPLPPYYRSYEHPITGIQPAYEGLNLELVTEGDEIIPGVSVLETPGHSPGHISVSVNAASGEYLITGDAILHMDHIKAIPELHYPISPPGSFVNLIDCWNSIERLKARAKSPEYLLVSHDTGLLERVEKTPVFR